VLACANAAAGNIANNAALLSAAIRNDVVE
jgi:hypothetical protein